LFVVNFCVVHVYIMWHDGILIGSHEAMRDQSYIALSQHVLSLLLFVKSIVTQRPYNASCFMLLRGFTRH